MTETARPVPKPSIEVDCMPQASAYNLPEGLHRFSSVGQLWVVKNRQWVRIHNPTAGQAALADNHSTRESVESAIDASKNPGEWKTPHD